MIWNIPFKFYIVREPKTKTMKLLHQIIQEIDSFPCVYCGQVLPEKSGFCTACYDSLPLVLNPRCPGCGAENDGIFDLCGKCLKEEKRVWETAFSVMRMEGAARELIHRFKYGRETAIARTLGEVAADLWLESNEKVDMIVPTPLHWTRQFLRGYNQSELLAEIIADRAKIPCNKVLKRKKMTSKQANLDRKQRKKNLIGAFSVKKGAICRNRTILLLDDVMTTGTTLTSAASALLESGAKQVKILVLARA